MSLLAKKILSTAFEIALQIAVPVATSYVIGKLGKPSKTRKRARRR